MTSLAQLADIQMGYPFRSRLEHNPTGTVTVVQMKDLGQAGVDSTDTIRLSLPDVMTHHLLQPGDLLFRSRGLNNQAVQVPEGLGTAIVAAPIVRIRARRVDPAYLCWCLNSPMVQSQLAGLAAGTSVRMVSADSLKDVQIPVPPGVVQRRIAAVAALLTRERELLHQIARDRERVTTHILIEHARRTSRKATS